MTDGIAPVRAVDDGTATERRAAPNRGGPVAARVRAFRYSGAGTVDGGPGRWAAATATTTPTRPFTPAIMPLIVLAGVVLALIDVQRALLPVADRCRGCSFPVFGFLAVLAAAKWLQARHPDEPWLARFLVLAVVAKEIASFLRYRTLVNAYGDVGDASVYDTYGRRFANFWLHNETGGFAARSTTSARATSCGGSPASSTTSSAPT